MCFEPNSTAVRVFVSSVPVVIDISAAISFEDFIDSRSLVSLNSTILMSAFSNLPYEHDMWEKDLSAIKGC